MKNYKKRIIDEYYNILPSLIDSFTEYYGEENRCKIENLIHNLIVVFCEKNIGTEMFQKKSIKYYKKYLSVKNNSGSKQNSEIELKAFLNFLYYSSLSKFNSLKKSIIITSNVPLSEQLIYDVENTDIPDASGFANMVNGVEYIALYGCGIKILALIHEINHLLSKGYLSSKFDDKKELFYGFDNSGDFIYEIINEYISLDILKIFKTKVATSNPLLDFNTNTGYIDLDSCSKFVIKTMYIIYYNAIKESLITGKGYKILNIIGKENYQNMNAILLNAYDNFIKIKKKNPQVKRENIILTQKFQEMIDRMKTMLALRFEEYEKRNDSIRK